MKSGVAAGVDAAVELARDGGLSTGALIVAAVADEEHASLGADTFASMYRADAAVVTEPTGLRLATCQKGFEWVEVETFGRVAHGSRPAEGRDAILAMGRVLSRLDALNAELEGAKPHPTLGVASLHGSTIDGGRELSVYPDRCRLRLERRSRLTPASTRYGRYSSRRSRSLSASVRNSVRESVSSTRPRSVGVRGGAAIV